MGFFLLGAGRATLEQLVGYRPPLGERLLRAARRHPDLALGGSAMLGTAAALAALLWMAGAEARPAWLLLVLLALLPANEVALNVIQQLITSFLRPQRLPKLDFRESGVPAESRTAVVIPTLFASVESVEQALENLEVQFLANRGANLHFVVLGDFTDAPTEVQEDDAAIVQAAIAGVTALNARYGPGDNAFYLLHRPRRCNPQQGVWMGWERKRGKLTDFNHLVRGGAEGAFSVVLGDLAVLRGVRYVITLDADTILPPETAPLLVGAMAHPLNRAGFDAVGARVVRGYGILQPRVGVSLPSANRTRFAAIYSGHPGVDPYTTAVSDMYQDLYGEGSFTGKGIYDVEAFEQATHGRFPPNTAPLARSDRRLLRPRRAGDRHPGVRRLSVELPDLDPAQAPVDPRRLAAPPLDTAHHPRSRRSGAESALGDLALEDHRQPAPQRGGARPAGVPGRGVDGASRLSPALDGALGPRRGRAVDRHPPARRAPPAARPLVARLLRGDRP